METISATSIQTRNQSYLDIIANEDKLQEVYKLLLKAIVNRNGEATMQELRKDLPELEMNIISGRINDLVNKYEILFKGETAKFNKDTKKYNTVWKLDYSKFNGISLMFFKKSKRKVA